MLAYNVSFVRAIFDKLIVQSGEHCRNCRKIFIRLRLDDYRLVFRIINFDRVFDFHRFSNIIRYCDKFVCQAEDSGSRWNSLEILVVPFSFFPFSSLFFFPSARISRIFSRIEEDRVDPYVCESSRGTGDLAISRAYTRVNVAVHAILLDFFSATRWWMAEIKGSDACSHFTRV